MITWFKAKNKFILVKNKTNLLPHFQHSIFMTILGVFWDATDRTEQERAIDYLIKNMLNQPMTRQYLITRYNNT